MAYKIKEEEIIKYYTERLIPLLIKDTAMDGQINLTTYLGKFGLPTPWLTKIKDYLIAQGILINE